VIVSGVTTNWHLAHDRVGEFVTKPLERLLRGEHLRPVEVPRLFGAIGKVNGAQQAGLRHGRSWLLAEEQQSEAGRSRTSTLVHHPDFGGKVAIKAVLPTLVEGMRYGHLVRIADGGEASAKLERLIFGAGVSDAERGALRGELLEYCKLDTWAMVKLLERLWELAA